MAQPRLEPAVELDAGLPGELVVGRGSCLFISGSCRQPGRRIERIDLVLDGEGRRAIAAGLPDGRFWGHLEFGALGARRQARVGLRVWLDDGRRLDHELGEITLEPSPSTIEAAPRPEVERQPTIAICMATFEPPAGLLERQIESLRGQTHRSWVCLVSDDCSSPAAFERLRSIVGDDERFSLSRSPRRLGAYRNFERALSMVPAEAELVAFCDQDDRWYPDKLATLLAHLGDAGLVFSDMRVLDEGGEVVSETFWSHKRNNYSNLASLLLDNTVTGAACLFRRRLLDLALPFPPAFEGSWHDHWMASVALGTDSIAYVDRPLYDYVQHGVAITGVHPAARAREEERQEERPALLSRAGLRLRLAEGGGSYFRDLCRVGLAARTLELRAAGAPAGARKRRAMRRVARLVAPPEPVGWLLLRLARLRVGLNETLGFERVLLKAIAWRRVEARRARRGAQRAKER